MEENKPLVTETEYPDSDTDIINGDGTPIIDTSDKNVDATQEESNTSKSDAEENTEDSSTTDTEENGVEEDTTTEIATDPANDPATLESALLVSTYAALNKLAEYVPLFPVILFSIRLNILLIKSWVSSRFWLILE